MCSRGYLRLVGIGFALAVAGVTGVYAESGSQQIQHNIDTLMQTNSCPGCNLQGADLNRMELSGADLSGADLSEASFFLTDLSQANLSGANLYNAKFGGADLANADLRNADLRGAVLDGAYLKGSLMDGSMSDMKVEPAEVAAEIKESVDIPDQTEPTEIMDHKKVTVESDQASAEEPKMQPAQQSNEAPPVKNVTPMQQISTDGEAQKKSDGELTRKEEKIEPDLTSETKTAETQTSVMEELEPATIDNKDVIAEKATVVAAVPAAAPMVNAELEYLIDKLLDEKRCYACQLQGADLHGKNLRKTDIERSDLSGANLEDIDFELANLKGVSFKGANLKNADFRKADLYKADLSGADLTGADFKDAQLDEADFSGAIGYQPAVITQ